MDKSARELLRPSDLTDPEAALVRVSQTGNWWDASGDHSYGSPLPAGHLDDGSGAIRAQVLYQILSGHGELLSDAEGHTWAPRAVRIVGARIEGQLDLHGMTARCPLELVDCTFEYTQGPVDLANAAIPRLAVRTCRAPSGIDARNLSVKGELDLRFNQTSMSIDLSGASIGGTLNLSGSRLGSASSASLVGDGMHVGGFLIARGMFCEGRASLLNASVGANASFDGARFQNAGDIALLAEGLQVAGSVFARASARVVGALVLQNCKVGGDLVFDSSRLENRGGVALNMESAHVGGNLSCRAGFRSVGEVSMLGSTVTGTVNLSGGEFLAEGATSLFLDRCAITGSLLCREGFLSTGVFSLIDASIGRELGLDGASLRNPGGEAVRAFRVEVGSNVFVRAQATVEGTIQLTESKIGSSLIVSGSTLQASDSNLAMSLKGASIGADLILRPTSMVGDVDLRGAAAATYSDNEVTRSSGVYTRGFRYDSLSPEPPMVTVSERLRWLAADPEGFSPVPYTQLARVWRERGHSDEARRLLVESQRLRRSRGTLASRVLSGFLRHTIGYGYKPWQGVGWLLGVLVGGAVWIDRLPRSSFQRARGAPDFHGLLFTLDSMIPFIDMGFNKWVPSGVAQLVVSGIVVVGWVLITALVAALSGVLRRAD